MNIHLFHHASRVACESRSVPVGIPTRTQYSSLPCSRPSQPGGGKRCPETNWSPQPLSQPGFGKVRFRTPSDTPLESIEQNGCQRNSVLARRNGMRNLAQGGSPRLLIESANRT